MKHIAAAILIMTMATSASAGWNDFKKWTRKNLGGMADGECYKYILTAGQEGSESCSF